MSKKLKVKNPNVFKVGLNFMDGIRSVVVPPKGYLPIPEEEIDYINSTSSIFKRKMLIIENEEKNEDLGYDTDSVANYSDNEIRELIKGHLNKIKSVLTDEKEKHVVDRVVTIAREFDDLSLNKIKFFEEWSGYQFRLIDEAETDKK